MDVKLLDATAVSKLLETLIVNHDEIHFAVAWGYNGRLADCLLSNSHKFISVTFGVNFCHTDPDLISRLVGVSNAYVAQDFRGTFHPKLYYFRTDDVAEAIIGSANFTAGGLGKNWEASVHAKGHVDDPFFRQLRGCLTGYEALRTPVTAELADSYRLQFDAAKSLTKPKNPILRTSDAAGRFLTSPLIKMEWNDYVREIQASPHHNVDERLSLLRTCQCLFARVGSFSALSSNEWKAIAGVIGDKQKREGSLNNHDWAWFGSMKGMGDFANRVAEQDVWLARAIDTIPRHGEVTRAQYETFRDNFLKAFEKSSRIGGVPTATRLLAMKRPDSFVCISKPNKIGLAGKLAFSGSTLNLDNYWDRVIQPIRISAWYNSPRPSGWEAELWDARVAMLDAIYYDPN
ncbi:phospholipase D family protein [Phyllobacterium sp. 0TCS1.6C]|uniref:phospholipase D family protein n=1 Tax=unclassified Phyllobacterium TaxID=2638441 RepID=UPI002263EC92|nr:MULTISPECIES: phospholipase D family protein [unclassified Phyllobacterium]MCX8281777.1 phospholipase D family protein [Phyllobacterium sp. 0TCS1.6C]MCX8295312.1 phospholipase D family protein [Phyllobacterium sp. 0TCS1.6A]